MKHQLYIIGILLILPVMVVRAQGDERAGTAGSTHLLVVATPRTAALSTAPTTGLDRINPVEALAANPAAMVGMGGTHAMFSRTEYVVDIGINYMEVVQHFGATALGITLKNWDFGTIDRQTGDLPERADFTYDASVATLGLSLA